jgi:hypothetical protein
MFFGCIEAFKKKGKVIYTLNMVSDPVSSFVAELFNRSIATGQVPRCFKHAYITLIVKKAGLDNTDLSSNRPISNLSTLSKILERLIATQLLS